MAFHGGIGEHIHGLMEGLAHQADELPPVVVHAAPECTVHPPLHGAPVLPGSIYGLRRRLFLPVPAVARLMHYPHWNTPLFRRKSTPTIATVHDLIHLRVTEVGGSFLRRAYIRQWIRDTIRGSEAIVTGSHHARLDIASEFQLDPASIHVIGNGISASWTPMDEDALCQRLHSLSVTAPYLILSGSAKAHKNLPWAIPAIASWLDRESLPHRLILTTPIPGIQELSDRVQTLGWLHRDDYRALVQGADGLIMPSLYEGFGLPVIEAQALGVPVVCSTAASLPEVSGGPACAALFHPESTEELHGALRRAFEPDFRANIIQAGRTNASLYTWNQVTRRLIALWKQFL
jgi:glycosyltransferase involved in cell wall biosynthesis